MAQGLLSPKLGRMPPVIMFPENVDNTDAERSAIRYHFQLVQSLLDMLTQLFCHQSIIDIGTVVLFIDGRIRAVFNPDDELFREFLDELIVLQDEFTYYVNDPSPSPAIVGDLLNCLQRQYEDIDRLTQGVMANLPQCYVNNVMHSRLLEVNMHPALRPQFPSSMMTPSCCQKPELNKNAKTNPIKSTSETKKGPQNQTKTQATKKVKTAHLLSSNNTADSKGFHTPRKFAKINSSETQPTVVSNPFDLLNTM